MKNSIYLLLILAFISCNKDDGAPTSNVSILDFNPKHTFTAEEVTIETTELDSTATIEVLFSGVPALGVRREDNTIVARVPSGAKTGEFVLKYNSVENVIGDITISEETDRFYGRVYGDNFDKQDYFELNIDQAELGELFVTARGYDTVYEIVYSKGSNVAYNEHYVQCGSTGCLVEHFVQNLDNGMSWKRSYCADPECSGGLYVLAVGNNFLYYSYYFFNPTTNQTESLLIALDLITMESTVLRDYNIHGSIRIARKSVHIEQDNVLVGYDKSADKFVRANLNDFTSTSFQYPDVTLTQLLASQSGKIFAILGNYTIVEISPENGEVLEEIYLSDSVINSLEYSESTGRFFWLQIEAENTILKIYNPANQLVTSIPYEQKLTGMFTDY